MIRLMGLVDLNKFKPVSEELDPVGKEDGDIDNDGDKDSSDKYLQARRDAIGKAMKKESTIDETEQSPTQAAKLAAREKFLNASKSAKDAKGPDKASALANAAREKAAYAAAQEKAAREKETKKVNEGEEDHEVSMSHSTLDNIIKNATELKTKMGDGEKDIPAWIQDHIAVAGNNLEQANTNYHEYEETPAGTM